ncbi:MAG: glycerophosphodiester phosphodiesterase [Bdellovibrio sp.]
MRGANWITQRPIAHRGLHRGMEIPENSLRAFDAAIERGFPIELDVQFTKDRELIVFHDDDLLRLTGREGRVEQVRYDEMKDLKLFGTDQKIPTFAEVLDYVDGRVPLLIELKTLKNHGAMEPLVLELLDQYHGEFAIQSFNPKTVLWLKKNAPEIRRGYLSGLLDDEELNPVTRAFLSHLGPVPFIQPDFIGYDKRGLDSASIRWLKKYSQIPVIAWTVREKSEEAKILSLADNIIFEGFEPSYGK